VEVGSLVDGADLDDAPLGVRLLEGCEDAVYLATVGHNGVAARSLGCSRQGKGLVLLEPTALERVILGFTSSGSY